MARVDEVLTNSCGALGRGQGRTFESPPPALSCILQFFSVLSLVASLVPSLLPHEWPGALTPGHETEEAQGHTMPSPARGPSDGRCDSNRGVEHLRHVHQTRSVDELVGSTLMQTQGGL